MIVLFGIGNIFNFVEKSFPQEKIMLVKDGLRQLFKLPSSLLGVKLLEARGEVTSLY